MPTDDERREVARKLRKGTGKGMQLILNVAFSAFEFTGCSERTLNADEAALKLADLIEPEPERTCRNVCEWNIDTFHFTCSECGAEIGGDDWGDSPVFVGDYHEQLRYCPSCGARVIG